MPKIFKSIIFGLIHIFDKKYLCKHEEIYESFLFGYYLFNQVLYGFLIHGLLKGVSLILSLVYKTVPSLAQVASFERSNLLWEL